MIRPKRSPRYHRRPMEGMFLLCLVCALFVPARAPAFTSRTVPGGSEAQKKAQNTSPKFEKGRVHVGFGVGAGPGLDIWGSHQRHDLAMAALGAGWMLTDTLAAGQWYQGSLEMWGELFGGFQFNPTDGKFAGLMPLLRYNFSAMDPWVPFLEAGAGLVGTDIQEPDLSGDLQVSLQGGLGIYYFWSPRQALALQSRLVHFSNAGVDDPNNGLNALQFLIGIHWFY